MTIYKDKQGGAWVYWIDNHDSSGRIYLTPEGARNHLRRGYKLVQLNP